MRTEQRKNIRFLVEDKIIVALRNGSTKIGKVKDISLGGLSFEHIYDEHLNLEPLKREVFLWANAFSLSKIACRVVYDIPIGMPPEYESLPTRFITRRCGVQFETLSEDQRTQLDFFLKTYTKETALNGLPQPL
jgi:hypothetical protein